MNSVEQGLDHQWSTNSDVVGLVIPIHSSSLLMQVHDAQ